MSPDSSPLGSDPVEQRSDEMVWNVKQQSARPCTPRSIRTDLLMFVHLCFSGVFLPTILPSRIPPSFAVSVKRHVIVFYVPSVPSVPLPGGFILP